MSTRAAARRIDGDRHAPSALAREALERIGRILSGCGVSAEELRRLAAQAFTDLPRGESRIKRSALAYFDDAAHILTLWHSSPQFLNAKGAPIPLSRSRGSRSIGALLEQVNPTLDLDRLIRHLHRYGSIRRRGALWVPTRRYISYRGHPLGQHLHGLQVLLGMLRNIEHNVAAGRRVPTWFEYVAENSSVPRRASRSIDQQVGEQGLKFLHRMDRMLRLHELHRKGRERAMRVGIGVYLYETPSGSARRPRPRSRSRTRSAR